MSVPVSEQKLLALRSGNLCAFPQCGRSLVKNGPNGEAVIVGEIAHIVGDSHQGPRGRSNLTDEEKDRADNLVYFCEACHKLVDKHPKIYSVAVLRQMKLDHERRVHAATKTSPPAPRAKPIVESLHGTLLRVAALPSNIFAAPCAFVEGQEKEVALRIKFPAAKEECVPFLLRDKKLFSFHHPGPINSPFHEVVDCRKIDEIPVLDFSADPEGSRRVTALLNSSLRRFLGIRNLAYDKLHHRYYFQPIELGKEREESYHSLTGRRASRAVVWQPKRMATGEPRDYWLHLAASLRFLQLAERQWGLSIRIERHITVDGKSPFPAEEVGRKVTKLKARMFNDIYLAEVHFWRDFLSEGKPRFILNYGAQSCIIESELVRSQIESPGIEQDVKQFTNQAFTDDLFSFAEYQDALGGEEERWELEAESDEDTEEE